MTPTDPQARARAKLAKATKAFETSKAQHERDREALAAAIVEALKADIGPSEVARIAPYDRQHIGRISKAAGIPPRRPATVVSKRKAEKRDDTA